MGNDMDHLPVVPLTMANQAEPLSIVLRASFAVLWEVLVHLRATVR